MRRRVVGLMILALASLLPDMAAADVNHSNALRGNLGRQVHLIRTIIPYVERVDLHRVIALRAFAQRALDSMRSDGLANMVTIQRLQELVIGFRFSKDLFRQIETARTAEKIKELQTISQNIASLTGFDKSPYTQITASVFEQIHELVKQLSALPLSAEMNAKIRAIHPEIGRLLAVAKQGDHSETFQRASEVTAKIKALYPDFNTIMTGNVAFYIVLEIQGLTEYYAEFSRTNEGGAS